MNKYKITCPHCQQALNVPIEYAGQTVECVACKKEFMASQPPQGNLTPKPQFQIHRNDIPRITFPTEGMDPTIRGGGENFFWDFVTFRRMITPVLLQILFWIGCIACVIFGIISIGNTNKYNPYGAVIGILVILLGPLYLRLMVEFTIVIFRMNETLTDIKNTLQSK